MKFFKVKPEYDQKRIKPNGSILIANELYTVAERKRMPQIPNECFVAVELHHSQTYWCFGARFQTRRIDL